MKRHPKVLKQGTSSDTRKNKKKNKVYGVVEIISLYKEDPEDPVSYVFKHKHKAISFMRKTAKETFYDIVGDQYEDSYENEDGEEQIPNRELTPTTSRSECGLYWYQNENRISFGEDQSMGQCYRRVWGMVTLSEEVIDESKD